MSKDEERLAGLLADQDRLVRALIIAAGGEVTLPATALAEASLSVFAWNDNPDGSRTYQVQLLNAPRR